MRSDTQNMNYPHNTLGGGTAGLEYASTLLQPWMDKPELLEKHFVPASNSWMMILRTAFRMLKTLNQNNKKLAEEIMELRAKNEELEFLSSKDSLTGLKNKRGFEEAFAAELDRINRDQSKGGLLLTITLDNFGAISDVYGSRAVDATLDLISTYLAKTIRKMDTAARLNVDEFVLLLSNTTERDALDRAQQISVGLNSLKLDWFGKTIPVHAGLGIKAFGKGDSANIIFEEAETKLTQDHPKMEEKVEVLNKPKTKEGDQLVKEILASLSA